MTLQQNNEIQKRYTNLKVMLNKHAYLYHVLDSPEINDEEYDSLFRELKDLEAKNPKLITKDSPSQRVGSVLKGDFKKVEHKTRMLSLNDVFSYQEILDWNSRITKLTPNRSLGFFCDIKMDGLACSLVYKDGVLELAVTRGDSFVGEDVTNNVRTIKNVPLSLVGDDKKLQGRVEVRGEIVILKSDFEKLNQKQKELNLPEFKNPRNLAAGTIRQLDPKLVAKRPLTFIAYDLILEDENVLKSHQKVYDTLTEYGFLRNKEAKYCSSLEEVKYFINKWSERRSNLPYMTDGIVIKHDDRAEFYQLGVVGKQPRGAVAFKYKAETATSVVRDIVISIGRTGAATPVAVIDPVVVAGTTVQNASLHNADEIKRLDVRVGDTVVVFKAGEIIPQIQSVVAELRSENSSKFDFEAELLRQHPELTFSRPKGEVVYRVASGENKTMLKRNLEHFTGKSALDIDSLGEKNVALLVDSCLVGDIADIYTLKKEQILKLDRFADISASKLIDSISHSKKPQLDKFLFGLGIRHVGAKTSSDIVNHFSSLEKMKKASFDDFARIDGVGDVVARSLTEWFLSQRNLDLLEKFSLLGVEPVTVKKIVGGKFSGMNFCVTGTLKSMSRDEAARKIQDLGGFFQSSVGKTTTYLVAGGKIGASKKQKAEKFGVEIVEEAKFLDMIKK